MSDKDDKPITLYQAIQLKAVEAALTYSEENFFRRVTRWYSKTFSTPLHHVRTALSWPDVLRDYYEHNMENLSYNEIYDLAITDLLPEFIAKREDEDAEFASLLVEEQRKTLKRKAEREGKDVDKKEQSLHKDPPQVDPVNLSFDEENLDDTDES